jgi:hypothetical protein
MRTACSGTRQPEGLAFLNMALDIVNQASCQSGWKLVEAFAANPVAQGAC